MVELLAGMDGARLADPLRDSLAVAGRSGTLSERMRGTAAQGRCRAKTGTLIGVSNLAGYCTSRAGRADRVRVPDVRAAWTAHPLQDRMAAYLARHDAP